ncbi:SDR family NAD(P)-dependent oxidoreductase [Nocardia nepalensis]|uniref:SDR family NAD(P)-dependent oxidoreductase n=1 Tax=Nocardia nepalensis TaxID=3375448 RepID=UPI003B66E368
MSAASNDRITLQGKNILLTGAAGGLGRQIAVTLARQGASLVLSGRDRAALTTLRDELGRSGSRAEIVVADLSRAEEAEGLVPRAEEALGPLDVVVSNAGIEIYAGYATHVRAELEATIGVNLLAPMLVVRSALPGMLERGSGRIVLVSSLSGKGPNPYGAAYAASKAGLVGLARSLRAEFHSRPVSFSVVCPSFITEASDGMYVRMQRAGLRAPRTFGTATATACADAVLDAVLTGRPEILVNSRPMRPLLALGELFPALSSRLLVWLGITSFFRSVAEQRGRG